jgi:hypothetical protein
MHSTVKHELTSTIDYMLTTFFNLFTIIRTQTFQEPLETIRLMYKIQYSCYADWQMLRQLCSYH